MSTPLSFLCVACLKTRAPSPRILACQARWEKQLAEAAKGGCLSLLPGFLFEVSLVTGCHRISGSWAGSALDGGTFALEDVLSCALKA